MAVSNTTHPRPRPVPDEAPQPDDDDGLELPVAPDEGCPLIPDEERVIGMPF